MDEMPKKKYNKPLMVEHGSIKKLTKSAADDGSDLDGGMKY